MEADAFMRLPVLRMSAMSGAGDPVTMGTGRRPGLLDAEAANLDQVPAGRRRDAIHEAATRTASSGGMFRIMAMGNAENMAHIGYAAMTEQTGPRDLVTVTRAHERFRLALGGRPGWAATSTFRSSPEPRRHRCPPCANSDDNAIRTRFGPAPPVPGTTRRRERTS
jgi:hypothetical protein